MKLLALFYSCYVYLGIKVFKQLIKQSSCYSWGTHRPFSSTPLIFRGFTQAGGRKSTCHLQFLKTNSFQRIAGTSLCTEECRHPLIWEARLAVVCDWQRLPIASRDVPKCFWLKALRKSMGAGNFSRTLLSLTEVELDGHFIFKLQFYWKCSYVSLRTLMPKLQCWVGFFFLNFQYIKGKVPLRPH